MKDLELGIVRIEYDIIGKATSAVFTPTMKVDIDPAILTSLSSTYVKNDLDAIKNNANHVFASWFAKTNEIELADRDHYGIDTEIVECQKDLYGNIRLCRIKFIFKELVTAL